MNKRFIKKALTAVLSAALVMTSVDMAFANASAEEKVYVDGVYTNVQKATMSIGTTKQITAYVEPENATEQNLSYRSSDSKVAKVSKSGLITAVSSGKATITVKALDGSGQTETVKITVLKDLKLTKTNVDSDNEIIVLDKTYGNIIIDSSVGDADIYLAGITVKGVLTLDSGEYTVQMYDSTAAEVVIDDISEIVSFAETSQVSKAPTLKVGNNTEITEINARINAMVKQEDGSSIEGLTFSQGNDGKITLYLEGYTGSLIVDPSFGDMEIVATGCNFSNVTANGGKDAGKVLLTNAGDSSIDKLNLTGAAKIELAVPTNEVNIDRNAKGTSFSSKESIGTINNTGAESKINVSGAVDNFISNGLKADIDVTKGGYVGTIDISGDGSLLYGSGEVSEAYINADNCRIDTVNTLVTVGKAEGTTVQNNQVAGGSSTTTIPPQSSGGAGGGATGPSPEVPINEGQVIIDNDFENGKHNLASIKGTVTIGVVDGDTEHGKVAKISSKSAEWAGAGINLQEYLGKYVTIHISAKMMAEAAGSLKTTINYNDSEYTQPEGCIQDSVPANTWVSLEGTYLLNNDIKSAILYFESPEDSSYYLDDVIITIQNIGEPIPAETVTLSETKIELNINALTKMTADVGPAIADVKTVTWTSSHPEVATVSAEGIVTAIKAGTTTITATSNCPYAEIKPVATCEVTVNDLVIIDLNKNYVFLTSAGGTKTLSAGADAVWTSSKPEVATVDENGVVTAVGNGTATINAKLSGGIGTCIVKVELQPEGALVFDFDEVTGTDANMIGGGKATIAADSTNIGSTNKVLKVEPSAGYSQVPYLEITLPEGKKLGDYTSLLAKIHLAQGDVTFKNLRVWAGKTAADITVNYNATSSEIGASDQKTTNTSFEAVAAEFGNTMPTTLKNLTGTVTLALGIMCDSTAGGLPTIYYLDELVLVPYTGDPVAITGLTLNPSTLTLVEGKSAMLTAIIEPEGYTTSGEITWLSSDTNIATVDATGKIIAIKEGTATIMAKTAIDGVSTVQYSDECVVTVNPKPVDAVLGAEDFELLEIGKTLSWLGYGGDEGIATVIVDPNNPLNKLLEVKPIENYGRAPIIDITLPEGKTLADYSHIKYKALWKSGDIGWKDILVEADTELTGVFNDNADRLIASYNRAAGATTTLEEKLLELSLDKKGSLTGTIQISIGISCESSKDGIDTVYYLDDIELVPKDEIPKVGNILSTGFEEGTLGGLKGSLGTGLKIIDGGFNGSTKALQVDLPDKGWGNPGFDLMAYKGKTVTIIAYMMHEQAETKGMSATIQYSTATDDQYENTFIDGVTGEWKKVVLEFAIPEDTSKANLYFDKKYTET
ncbi:MAG TPA: Ig-like domain-containing protein, partial [Mobilitalea sp.]|nr:Ig-like domain-containing protein [Mobilitalea sp.]